jgi:hypothetical protein
MGEYTAVMEHFALETQVGRLAKRQPAYDHDVIAGNSTAAARVSIDFVE